MEITLPLTREDFHTPSPLRGTPPILRGEHHSGCMLLTSLIDFYREYQTTFSP